MSTTQWIIDSKHSEIGFKEKYMSFTSVSGKLNNFAALLEKQVDIFENAKVKFNGKIEAMSASMQRGNRHSIKAKSAETNRFPKVSFTATSFDRIDEVNYRLTGDLGICDIKKPIILEAECSGLLKDPWGKLKAAFTIRGKINKNDWGLTWHTVDAAADENVRFDIDLLFIKKSFSE